MGMTMVSLTALLVSGQRRRVECVVQQPGRQTEH